MRKNRVVALVIIKWMDKALYDFITQDGIPDYMNSPDLQTIVRHRWPYLNDRMIQHHEVVKGVAEELCKAMEDRKTQMNDGLISYKEFIQELHAETSWAMERVEHILD